MGKINLGIIELTQASDISFISGNVDTLSGVTVAHTANTEIHVTAADKARWDSSSLWVSGTGESAIAQKDGGNTASGKLSVAMGRNTVASGSYSHAEGERTSATSYDCHAEGMFTQANASASHAEGNNTVANGDYSHAEGYQTSAVTSYSHAEGYQTRAFGYTSHTEGNSTTANGLASHAEGNNTVANGNASHTEGHSTIANNNSEHASGQYNISNSATTTFGNSGNTLFSVGNGTSDNARHNAFEIRQNGDIYFADTNPRSSASGSTYYEKPMIKLQELIWNGTKDEYDAIQNKNPWTIYLINE